MKKVLVSVIVSLACVGALSAQDSVYQVINKQTCACITAKSAKPFSLEDYRKCVTQTLNNNTKIIASQLKKLYPDTLNNYKKGYEFGQAVGSRLDTDLVYTCDAYFKIADTLRAASYRVSNSDSLRKLLVDLNGPDVPRDAVFYQRRALVSFLLGLLDNADRDALEVFKENPNNIAALFIHANYLEANKKYSDAAYLYYRLDQVTGQHAYLVSAAINNRKSREMR
jgi:tetratricopeptide (TPR) repeat protein